MKSKLSLLYLALFAVFNVSAQTFTQINNDGVEIKYTVTTDNHVKVVSNGYSGRVIIPETVTYENVAYVVNEVGTGAFSNRSDLLYVQLPVSLEKISTSSFNGSNNIDTLSLLCLNPPKNQGGSNFSENALKMVFGANLFEKITIQVPPGHLHVYRASPWVMIPNLTSLSAEPITLYCDPNVLVYVESQLLNGSDNEPTYHTLYYDILDTIHLNATSEGLSNNHHQDSIFLGWDKGVDFGDIVVEQADTFRAVVAAIGYEILDVNQISTPIKIHGQLGYLDGISNYHFPAQASTSTVYSSGLWIGGMTPDENLRACVSRYTCGDYIPGPLLIDGSCKNDLQTRIQFNRVWSVSREDIDDFIAHVGTSGYTIPENILSWPGNGATGYAEQLAPYYDADSNGIYNPRCGDYPLIRGDRMLFSIFNDASGHNVTSGEPMGMEIHMSAYAFDEPEDASLHNTVFLSLKTINRSKQTYRNTYLGESVDIDLGYGNDDYIGCDVQLGMAYCYNGRDVDGPGTNCFQGVPPAQGCAILAGPKMDDDGIDNPLIEVVTPNDEFGNNAINGANFGDGIIDNERFGMRRFLYYENNISSINGEPQKISDYYNYLQGLWKNGSHMKFGGNAISNSGGASEIPCDFIFPGDSDPLHWGTNGVIPDSIYHPNDWTELTAGDYNYPGDRRGIVCSGSFTFESGEENTLDLAFITGQSSENRFESINTLKALTYNARRQFIRDTTDSNRPFTYAPYSAPLIGINTARTYPSINVFPNPANDRITVTHEEYSDINIELFDIRGRKIMNVSNTSNITTFDISMLPSGLYIIRCGGETFKIMKK